MSQRIAHLLHDEERARTVLAVASVVVSIAAAIAGTVATLVLL